MAALVLSSSGTALPLWSCGAEQYSAIYSACLATDERYSNRYRSCTSGSPLFDRIGSHFGTCGKLRFRWLSCFSFSYRQTAPKCIYFVVSIYTDRATCSVSSDTFQAAGSTTGLRSERALSRRSVSSACAGDRRVLHHSTAGILVIIGADAREAAIRLRHGCVRCVLCVCASLCAILGRCLQSPQCYCFH